MYSLLILVPGLAAAGVAVWALLAWLRLKSSLLLFVIVTLAGAAAEALCMGTGRWIGIGTQLRDLYALPQLVAIFALPLSLFTFATMSRRYRFAWAKLDWGHGGVCLFATALLVWNLTAFPAMKLLWPACWQDVVWYARVVPAGLACPGTTPGDAGVGPLPVVRWIALAAWAGMGIGLWHRQGWPWLAAGMVPGIALLLLPPAWGPLPVAYGYALACSAMTVAAVRYARNPPPPLEDR